MGLPDRFISFRNHLNHATRARRANRIPKSISLIQRIEREDFWKQIAGILRHEALMISVLDDAQVLGNVDDVGWDRYTLSGQISGRLIQHCADVALAVRSQFR